jgi:hypothetical protein
MLKIKNYAYFFGAFFILIFALSLAVKADDDEEEDDYGISNQSALIGQTAQAKTVTSTSTEVITLKDSDGDGLLDADDPHPSIAEIYIVKDENKNGIVDEFEK